MLLQSSYSDFSGGKAPLEQSGAIKAVQVRSECSCHTVELYLAIIYLFNKKTNKLCAALIMLIIIVETRFSFCEIPHRLERETKHSL